MVETKFAYILFKENNKLNAGINERYAFNDIVDLDDLLGVFLANIKSTP